MAQRTDPNAILGALTWGGGADQGLSEEAQSRLYLLDQVLRSRKVKGTITSGKRQPDGTKSHHHEGNAIDFVSPGDMAKLAADLQGLGFRVQYQRKGQRNPNGSVASGDHLHVTLLGGAPQQARPKITSLAELPDPTPVKALKITSLADLPDPVTASKVPAGRITSLADLPDPTTTPAPRRDSAPAPAAPARPASRPAGGKPAVADLMGSLLRGEHLAPGQQKPTTTGTPGAVPILGLLALPEGAIDAAAAARSGVSRKPASGPARPHNLLERFGSLSNSYSAWLNELARQGRKVPSVLDDPAGHFAALPDALKSAFGQAVQNFGPEAVQPQHFRTMLGMKPGKAGRAAYNTAAVLDYVSSFATDPTGLVMTPVGKGVGAVLGATGRGVVKATAPVGRVLTSPQVARVEQATGRAIGAGLAKTEQALSQTDAGRRVLDATAAGVKAAQKGAEVLPPAARLITGQLRAALLSRPSSVFTNAVVNPITQSADELARHGIPLAKLGSNVKRAVGELGAYRKAGKASADVGDLLQHAPDILDAPVALGGTGSTWNPFLQAMGASDNLAKVALYKTLREGGLDAAAAAERVKVAMFDYGGLNKALRAADQHGLLLFGSFLGASTKSFAQQLATRPDLLNRYPRLQLQLFAEFPGSREEFDKLPPYQRTPFTFPVGNGHFIDLQRFHAWTTQLGFLQDVLQHGAPAVGIPKLGDLVAKTAAGPLVGAVTTEKRSVAPDGFSAPGLADLLHRVFPVAKDLNRVVSAWREIPLSDRRDDEAQSLLHAVAQAALGASVIRAEGRAEKGQRTSAVATDRARGATDLVKKLNAGLRSGTVKIPDAYTREAARLVNVDDAQREFRDAEKFFQQQALSGRNVPQADVRNAYLRLVALQQRLGELGRQQRR